MIRPDTFLFGANYPWSVDASRSMYGRDFGADLHGIHEGVSKRRAVIEKDLLVMRDAGISVLRWFLFCDGRAGIRFDKDHPRLTGPVRADLDTLLACAERTGIRLILVLLDYLWMLHGHVPESVRISPALVEHAFVPLLRHCGDNPRIMAWEVMNEPDWIVRELDVPRGKKHLAVPLEAFRQFVRLTADAVHTHTPHAVTVGGGRVRFLKIWDDDRMGLDVLQVHTYADFVRSPWDTPLYGIPCRDLQLQRPVLVGEFPADLSKHRPRRQEHVVTIPTSEYVSFLKAAGYAGALYWSFNAVDEFGSLVPSSLAHLA